MRGRTLVALAFIGATLLVAPIGASAADELGATIQSRLYADEDRTLAVWNRSTVTALFTFEPAGGWVVQPTELTLDPDERGSVEVTTTGANAARLTVRVRMAAPAATGQHGEAILTATLFTTRPFEPAGLLFLVGLAVAAGLALVVGVVLVRRGTIRLRVRSPIVVSRRKR